MRAARQSKPTFQGTGYLYFPPGEPVNPQAVLARRAARKREGMLVRAFSECQGHSGASLENKSTQSPKTDAQLALAGTLCYYWLKTD